MNEIIKAMEERRSIRKFKPDMPKKEDIEQIIELRDKISDDNRKIGGWDEGFDPFYGAPAMLIVLGRKEHPTYIYDGSLVMGNMMLAAHSLGLGSIWIHRAREEFETDEYKSLLDKLGVTGEWEGIGHCAIGYPDGDVPEAAPRKDGRVYWAE